MKYYADDGFTLIEFLVTMAVAAILIFVAVPGFYGVIQNNKVVSLTNSLSASFNYARTEAIRRGVSVLVCPAASASLSSCGTASNWANGWLVFLDANGNSAIDAASDVVKVHEALPSGMTAAATSAYVVYDSSGFVSSNTFTMTLTASGCYGNHARVITIQPSGQLSISYTSC